jgi:hypothetical protein
MIEQKKVSACRDALSALRCPRTSQRNVPTNLLLFRGSRSRKEPNPLRRRPPDLQSRFSIHDSRITNLGSLRRQRGAYLGFDYRDISGADGAIRIHVFAEIRPRNRIAHLRLGQADIGGIDHGIAIHIAD